MVKSCGGKRAGGYVVMCRRLCGGGPWDYNVNSWDWGYPSPSPFPFPVAWQFLRPDMSYLNKLGAFLNQPFKLYQWRQVSSTSKLLSGWPPALVKFPLICNTRLEDQQCQAQGLVFCSWLGLIQYRIRMCKIKRVILIGVWILMTPVSIVWTIFAKHLALLNVTFPIKMIPVLEV